MIHIDHRKIDFKIDILGPIRIVNGSIEFKIGIIDHNLTSAVWIELGYVRHGNGLRAKSNLGRLEDEQKIIVVDRRCSGDVLPSSLIDFTRRSHYAFWSKNHHSMDDRESGEQGAESSEEVESEGRPVHKWKSSPLLCHSKKKWSPFVRAVDDTDVHVFTELSSDIV